MLSWCCGMVESLVTLTWLNHLSAGVHVSVKLWLFRTVSRIGLAKFSRIHVARK